MTNDKPRISAVMVVGKQRQRAQEVLDALSAQTARDAMEIVLVDVLPAGAPGLHADADLPLKVVRCGSDESWGAIRAAGVYAARSPVVAFIEDHCIPDSGWAEALIDAHEYEWVGVSPAFDNGNSNSYWNRAVWMAEYGFWASPAVSGPASYLPGNNVSYKRATLLDLGDDLEEMMAVDFNLQQRLTRDGGRLYLESRARAAHQSYEACGKLLAANAVYARLMGAIRAEKQGWPILQRVIFGLAAPIVVPPLRIFRLGRSFCRRPRWRLLPTFMISLPVITIVYLSAAIGEAFGYLFGKGDASQEFIEVELQGSRARQQG